MASKQAGWRIYKQQMGLLDHGDALWEPAPIYSYKRVKLGDVGYVRRGRFHLLFSAGCPLGSRQLGADVPLTFEPLDIGHVILSQPRLPGYLSTNTVKETGAGLGASVCAAPSLEPGASFSFELTEKQGAALVTKYRTYREDIELESAFEEYTKRHYDSWVTFARNARHGNDIKPVLVTGVDMTRDFAMIAYSNNSTHLSSEFTTSVPLLASASASAWGTWHTQGLVHTNCGPQLCSPPPSPGTPDVYSFDNIQVDGTPNEYNQCVFIRYYTMRRRALMFPRVIKAAAGPHDLGSGDNYDETFPELTVPLSPDSDTGSDSSGDSATDYSSSVTSYDSGLELFHNVSSEEEDAFDAIAEYVFQNSEAETMLVHHRDVAQLREGTSGTEIPELLSEHRPTVMVDSMGVGRLVHHSCQQQTVTSAEAICPSTACHTLPGISPGRPSTLSILLYREDAWVLSRGLILLWAACSKRFKASSVNPHIPEYALDHLSHVSIAGAMSVGRAAVAGMFMGQSTRLSKSLLTPLNLVPSSWQFDLTLDLLQGGVLKVTGETLLMVLAEGHLDVKPTDSPSWNSLGWGDLFPPIKCAGGHEIRDVERRHSLPQPREMKQYSGSGPRPQSLWSKPQRSTLEEFELKLKGWTDELPATGDAGENPQGGDSWRHSARSVTSNGGSSTDLYKPRYRSGNWRSSDRFSLNSNGSSSSSSVFTRYSGSTTSTSLTALSSGTTSKRSSRSSALQREKRFSNVKMMDGTPWELDELPRTIIPKPPTIPGFGGRFRGLEGIIPPRGTSGDVGPTQATERGVLPSPKKLHRREYATSLTSLLRRRESSDETRSMDATPEADTLSLGRRARFKRFVKGIFKV